MSVLNWSNTGVVIEAKSQKPTVKWLTTKRKFWVSWDLPNVMDLGYLPGAEDKPIDSHLGSIGPWGRTKGRLFLVDFKGNPTAE